jgi:hypothetical protein
MVKLYVETVTGQLNGWGQCAVKAPGTIYDGRQSHYLLYAIKQRMGWNAADRAVDAEFESRRRDLSHKQF